MRLLAILIMYFFASHSFAATVNCRANVSVPGTSLSGNCNNGNCTLRGSGSYVSASGSCDDGSRFNASTSAPGAYVSARCRNGQLSASLNGYYLTWNGSCANGAYFSADHSYLSGSYVSGSCRENGYASARTGTDYVNIRATCSTTARIK